MIEVIEVHGYQVQEYINKGYEFMCATVDTYIETYSVQEEVQQQYVVTTNNINLGQNYNAPPPIYVTKSYPVSKIAMKFMLKRTPGAKLLYEKSLKNENDARSIIQS